MSREAIVNDCITLINIPSISTNKKQVTECLEVFLDISKRYGLDTYITPEKDIGIVEIGQGNETIGILVHLDVVGEGHLQKWKRPPFEGYFDGTYIWGRGAEDNKGPAVVALHVLKGLKEFITPLKKKIRLIIGTQEEVEWTDMKNYERYFSLPDYGFTPDGSFPIENREKGYADVRMRWLNDDNGDMEGNLYIESLMSGDSVNSIPSHGEGLVRINNGIDKDYFLKSASNKKICVEEIGNQYYKIMAKGRTSHSSLPDKGVNAIYLLCDFLKAFTIEPKSVGTMIRFMSRFILYDFYGKELGFFEENPYINGEYMDYTTIVPTILKANKNEASINLNLRTKIGISEKDIGYAMSRYQEAYGYHYEIDGYLDPLYVAKDKKFLSMMGDAYEEVTGFTSDFTIAFGTSYAKAMPNIVCFGPVFPKQEDYAHQENERIALDTLVSAAKIYALFLGRVSKMDTSFKAKEKSL